MILIQVSFYTVTITNTSFLYTSVNTNILIGMGKMFWNIQLKGLEFMLQVSFTILMNLTEHL